MAESKSRYWWAVVYPENMLLDWEDQIAEIVQLPYAYCIHDRDLNSDDEYGKVHAHLMIMWNGPTTYKNALRVFQDLALPGKICVHGLKMINDNRRAYNYLIHDTDDARKKGKYQYPAEQRIEGNNFDIHFYEQLSLEEKAEIFEELIDNVIMQGIYNLVDLRCWVLSLDDDSIHNYLEVMRSYSAPLQRYLDGMYQKTIYCTNLRSSSPKEAEYDKG